MTFPIAITPYEQAAPQHTPYQVQDVLLDWSNYHPKLNGGEGQSFAEIWPFIYTKPVVPKPMIVRFKGYWNLLESTAYPQDTAYEVQSVQTVSQTTSLKEELSAKISGEGKGLSGEISGSITKETTVEVVKEASTKKTFVVPAGQQYRYISWQWCVDYAFVFESDRDEIMYYNQMATSLRNGDNAACTIGVPNWVTCKTSQTDTQNIIYDVNTGKVISG